MSDRYLYPALFEPGEVGGYTVTFPDLPGCITEGNTLLKAFLMAKEALELHLYGMEEDGDTLPEPHIPNSAEMPQGAILTVVEAWMPLIRNKIANQSVKKNVTIPKWLNDAAESAGVNFSHVLQAALKQRMGITDESGSDETSASQSALLEGMVLRGILEQDGSGVQGTEAFVTLREQIHAYISKSVDKRRE